VDLLSVESDRPERDLRTPFAGGEAEQVTPDGGYVAFESYDGRDLIYLKPRGADIASGPVFQMSLATREEREILDRIIGRALLPARQGIFYIAPGGSRDSARLRLYDPATRVSKLLWNIDASVNLGLSASPDGRTILFSVQNPATADLMLIDNFR
jgi:Tol biopolymer transport system component